MPTVGEVLGVQYKQQSLTPQMLVTALSAVSPAVLTQYPALAGLIATLTPALTAYTTAVTAYNTAMQVIATAMPAINAAIALIPTSGQAPKEAQTVTAIASTETQKLQQQAIKGVTEQFLNTKLG